jgi:hypothetical protein
VLITTAKKADKSAIQLPPPGTRAPLQDLQFLRPVGTSIHALASWSFFDEFKFHSNSFKPRFSVRRVFGAI